VSGESKQLRQLANPVHRASVLPQEADIKEYVAKEDVSVYEEYVSLNSIRSAQMKYKKMKGRVLWDIGDPHTWEEISRKAKPFFTVEERQLTHIMIESLQTVPPSNLVVGDSNLFTKVDHKICEFATSKPDIIVCSANSAATVGTYVDIENDTDVETEDDLGLTIEAKRTEFELCQTIANMIKVATDLSVIAIRKRNFIQKVTVYGIAANYYGRKGKILRLEMDFEGRKLCILCSHFPWSFVLMPCVHTLLN